MTSSGSPHVTYKSCGCGTCRSVKRHGSAKAKRVRKAQSHRAFRRVARQATRLDREVEVTFAAGYWA